MNPNENGFSKKFSVQIPTDHVLDELARDHVFAGKPVAQRIMTRRRSAVSKNLQLEQPVRIHNRRKTLSGNRSNKTKSARGSDGKSKTQKSNPAQVAPRRKSTGNERFSEN